MNRGLVVSIGFFVAFVFGLGCGIGGLSISKAKASELNQKGVRIIKVTENSRYIFDDRYNLCFYETITQYGVDVETIGCFNFRINK